MSGAHKPSDRMTRKAIAIYLLCALAAAFLGAVCAVGSLIILNPPLCEADRYGEPVCAWDPR